MVIAKKSKKGCTLSLVPKSNFCHASRTWDKWAKKACVRKTFDRNGKKYSRCNARIGAPDPYEVLHDYYYGYNEDDAAWNKAPVYGIRKKATLKRKNYKKKN